MTTIISISRTNQPTTGIKTIINKGQRMETIIYENAFSVGKLEDKQVMYDPSTGEVYTVFYMALHGTTRHTITTFKKGLGFDEVKNIIDAN